MNTQTQMVTVGGHQLALNDDSFRHILSPSYSLLGVRRFVAKATKFCTAVDEKGNLTFAEIKDMPFKELREKLEKSGLATEDRIKELRKSYNEGQEAYYRASNQGAALCIAEATLRKSLKPVIGGKGNLLGFNIQARYVKASGKDAKIAQLEAEIAKLRGALPAPAAA